MPLPSRPAASFSQVRCGRRRATTCSPSSTRSATYSTVASALATPASSRSCPSGRWPRHGPCATCSPRPLRPHQVEEVLLDPLVSAQHAIGQGHRGRRSSRCAGARPRRGRLFSRRTYTRAAQVLVELHRHAVDASERGVLRPAVADALLGVAVAPQEADCRWAAPGVMALTRRSPPMICSGQVAPRRAGW